MQKNIKQPQSNFASKQCKIVIKVAQISNFQSLKFKVWTLEPYWGPKAPRRARRAPQPTAGARRMGMQHPDLLVKKYLSLDLIHIEKQIYVVASKYQFFNDRRETDALQNFNFENICVYVYIFGISYLAIFGVKKFEFVLINHLFEPIRSEIKFQPFLSI